MLRPLKEKWDREKEGNHSTSSQGNEVSGILNYMDDIAIYSETVEEHLVLLRKVLRRLQQFGLRAKLSKTFIGYKELKFLGRIIDKDGVRVDPDKVAPILALKKPKGPQAKSQLRAICGGANYYRGYIPDYAGIIAPLHSLLKKGVNVVEKWGTAQDQALARVKKALSTPPILAHPDPNKKYIIKTDASKGYAAGVCSQMGPHGERVIGYVSTKVFHRVFLFPAVILISVPYLVQLFG